LGDVNEFATSALINFNPSSASERSGYTPERFQDFCHKAKAQIRVLTVLFAPHSLGSGRDGAGSLDEAESWAT
jgi:hypothetical protein